MDIPKPKYKIGDVVVVNCLYRRECVKEAEWRTTFWGEMRYISDNEFKDVVYQGATEQCVIEDAVFVDNKWKYTTGKRYFFFDQDILYKL